MQRPATISPQLIICRQGTAQALLQTPVAGFKWRDQMKSTHRSQLHITLSASQTLTEVEASSAAMEAIRICLVPKLSDIPRRRRWLTRWGTTWPSSSPYSQHRWISPVQSSRFTKPREVTRAVAIQQVALIHHATPLSPIKRSLVRLTNFQIIRQATITIWAWSVWIMLSWTVCSTLQLMALGLI